MGLLGKARGWLARPVWDQALGLAHRYDKFRDARFERAKGLNLSSEVQHAELATDNAGSAAQATCYQASASTLLKLAISEAAKAGFAFDNLVDIGCGKGKICIDARRIGGFRRVIGLDFSAALVAIAEENARKCGYANDIELVCADATQYDLPEGANLVYLFNPFGAEIMRAFAERNLAHFADGRSCVAYVYDAQRDVLADLGFETLFRNQTLRMSLLAPGPRIRRAP